MGRAEVVVEVKKQLWLSGPLIASNLLQYILQVISVMFVGHLGELALSSAAMASSFAAVTGFSLMMGMGSALDTFCGQAFGAKQHPMLGIYLQRAILVLMIICIPIAFMWAYTGHILLALRQNPEISVEAGIYARWMIPSLFAYGLIQCQVRFLQTQNIVFPLMLCSGLTTLLHILVCWILVFKFHLGNKGAALANSISYWFNVLLLALYIKLSPACKTTWTGFSREALHDVLRFVRLATSSAIMICLEFWSFELVVLLSGLLPNPKLETSVLSVSLNTCSLLFQIPYGVSGAVSTRVSNELGAGHPWDARLAVCVAELIEVIEGLMTGMMMLSVRNIWGKVYSSEQEVVKHLAAVLPYLALAHFLDGTLCVLSGTIRGIGRQRIGAFINLLAYYAVGIPVSVLLSFVAHLKGKGLWIGICCALLAQDLLYGAIMIFIDWEKEARKANERVQNSIMDTENEFNQIPI